MKGKDTYSNNVLINKFGITDAALLRETECKFAAYRGQQLAENPIQGNFDLEHLRAIHERLYGDLYDWAGKVREVDLGKVDPATNKEIMFYPQFMIKDTEKKIFGALKDKDYLRNMEREEFAGEAAALMGKLNLMHPFREGNGHTTRLFMNQLAHNAGWEFNLDNISRERMTAASVASVNYDYGGLKDIINDSIRPLNIQQSPNYLKRIQEIEGAKDLAALGSNPSAKDRYDFYAKQALNSNNGKWSEEFDKGIVLAMFKDDVGKQNIISALREQSPNMIGLPKDQANNSARNLVKAVENDKELKQFIGMGR